METVSIYCGSSEGNEAIYKHKAEELASYFVANDITMINGGGSIGIMGIMSNKMLELGGKCKGVITLHLKDLEVAHYGMTELITTPCMHSRKKIIMEISDAFIALPGGYGTLDEVFECITWRHLNLHNKPVGLLNINGYFDPLIEMIQKMKDKGFMNQSSMDALQIDDSIEGLFRKLEKDELEQVNKFLP